MATAWAPAGTIPGRGKRVVGKERGLPGPPGSPQSRGGEKAADVGKSDPGVRLGASEGSSLDLGGVCS